MKIAATGVCEFYFCQGAHSPVDHGMAWLMGGIKGLSKINRSTFG